jgi:hypothetical protein
MPDGRRSEGAARRAPAPRRVLGEAWRDWDPERDLAPTESRARPARFLWVTLAIALVAAGAWQLLVWLAAPRLASFGTGPEVLRILRWVGGALALLPALLLWGVPLRVSYSRRLAAGLVLFVVFVWSGVESLARLLRLSRDHLGHSFVQVINHLSLCARAQRGAREVLVLAPRCLRPEIMRGLRELADERGARFSVVGGGEQALAAIDAAAPQAVLAVACERDLVAGIREVAPHLTVLGLANRRPEGPCRNSEIDLGEARRLLAQLFGSRG